MGVILEPVKRAGNCQRCRVCGRPAAKLIGCDRMSLCKTCTQASAKLAIASIERGDVKHGN